MTRRFNRYHLISNRKVTRKIEAPPKPIKAKRLIACKVCFYTEPRHVPLIGGAPLKHWPLAGRSKLSSLEGEVRIANIRERNLGAQSLVSIIQSAFKLAEVGAAAG